MTAAILAAALIQGQFAYCYEAIVFPPTAVITNGKSKFTFPCPRPMEMFASKDGRRLCIFDSGNGVIREYRGEDGKLARSVDLSKQLSGTRFEYGKEGLYSFQAVSESRWLMLDHRTGKSVWVLGSARDKATPLFELRSLVRKAGYPDPTDFNAQLSPRIAANPAFEKIAVGIATKRRHEVTGAREVATIITDRNGSSIVNIGRGNPLGWTSNDRLVCWDRADFGQTSIIVYSGSGRRLRTMRDVPLAYVCTDGIFLVRGKESIVERPVIEHWNGDLSKKLGHVRLPNRFHTLESRNLVVLRGMK